MNGRGVPASYWAQSSQAVYIALIFCYHLLVSLTFYYCELLMPLVTNTPCFILYVEISIYALAVVKV